MPEAMREPVLGPVPATVLGWEKPLTARRIILTRSSISEPVLDWVRYRSYTALS
jgi:hypothetical protein